MRFPDSPEVIPSRFQRLNPLTKDQRIWSSHPQKNMGVSSSEACTHKKLTSRHTQQSEVFTNHGRKQKFRRYKHHLDVLKQSCTSVF